MSSVSTFAPKFFNPFRTVVQPRKGLPASRSFTVSPTHTIGTRPAGRAARSPAVDPLIGFPEELPAFGVTDDHVTAAGVGQHCGEISPCTRLALPVMFWAPSATSSRGRRRRLQCREGRRDDPGRDPSQSATNRRTRSMASVKVLCIFQLPAIKGRRAHGIDSFTDLKCVRLLFPLSRYRKPGDG